MVSIDYSIIWIIILILYFSIKGEYWHQYSGERVKEDMVNYAMRMAQPAIQRLSHADSFGYLKETHNVFFGYVGKQQGSLWVKITNLSV